MDIAAAPGDPAPRPRACPASRSSACSATSARRSPTSSRWARPRASPGGALAGGCWTRASPLRHDRHRRRPGRRLRRRRGARTRARWPRACCPHLRDLRPDRCCWSRAGRSWWPRRVRCSRACSYVKESRGKRFVIVDAGMNDLLRPALYDAFHRDRARDAARRRGRAASTWWGRSARPATSWPATASWSVPRAGRAAGGARRRAPTASRWPRTTTCGRAPAEVLVEDGGSRLIRRRETFEDLVSAPRSRTDGLLARLAVAVAGATGARCVRPYSASKRQAVEGRPEVAADDLAIAASPSGLVAAGRRS